MMRSRYVYDKNGNMIYAEEHGEVKINEIDTAQHAGYYIQPDVQPFVSMVDGSVINSRSVYRDHLKQHGCVEIGNDSSLRNIRPKPMQSPPGLKEQIIRAVNQVEELSRRR